MMSYSNKLHNSSFQSNGGVNDGGSSGDDDDEVRFLGDVGGDVASATASSEELRWVTWPLA